jgi:hypothetical protein
MGALPHVDEHSTVVDAPPERSWRAAAAALSRSSSALPSAFARALGCDERHASGEPGAAGSTVPGFRVARSAPPSELALEGRHRFSRYALIFRVDPLDGGRSRVRAETRAEFPGLRGSVYRALVIGTRGHVLAVRRILAGIRRRAERPGPT